MLRAVWYKTSFSLTLFWRICLIRAWKHFLSRAVLLRAYSLSNSVTTRCPTYSFFMYRCIDTYCSVSVRLLSTSLSLSGYSYSSLCLLRAWLLSLKDVHQLEPTTASTTWFIIYYLLNYYTLVHRIHSNDNRLFLTLHSVGLVTGTWLH